ncbi:MAG: hypothetical protein V7720_15210 [Halioglobus sp.]
MPQFFYLPSHCFQPTIFQRLFLCWLCLSLFACATQEPQKSELPDRTFSSIALISPKDIIAINTPETRAGRSVEGATTGGASAGLGGVLIGAAVCGPYLYGLCVVGLGTAGLLAGGTAGALYGFTGISDDVAKELEQKAFKLNRQRDFQSELVNSVTSRVPAAMLAEPEYAEMQAIVTIEKIDFSREEGLAYLKVQVRLTFAATESQRKPEFGSRIFYSVTVQNDFDSWLNANSSSLDLAIDKCLKSIAEEIQAVLREHWAIG